MIDKTNITLVAFATDNWSNAAKRFYDQATKTNIFSNIYIVDEETMKKDTDFFKYHLEFTKECSTGFGGYIWKPYILESAFKKFPESDFFMYLDIGSEFNINKNTISRFYEYVSNADKNNIFAFVNRDNERCLSQCSVIDRIYSDAKYSNQFEANTLIFKNNLFSLNIIKEWKEKCVEDNYFNVFPNPKIKCCEYAGEGESLIHIYDQSVLSCILKKYAIAGVLDEASWYLPSASVSEDIRLNVKKYPIFTARNPFLYSVIGKCVQYKNFPICYHDTLCDDIIHVR